MIGLSAIRLKEQSNTAREKTPVTSAAISSRKKHGKNAQSVNVDESEVATEENMRTFKCDGLVVKIATTGRAESTRPSEILIFRVDRVTQ